jgi:hypothetical protein
MMKKNPFDSRKLSLNRETLRRLDRSGLEQAAGGLTAGCLPNTYTTCGTRLCQPHTNTC